MTPIIGSESQKKGWLAATESAVVFLPVSSSTPKDKLQSHLERLEESIKNGQLTPLQKAQYEIQIAWMKAGEVPDMEVVLFSKGLVMTEPDKSYFVVMAGIQVCMHINHEYGRNCHLTT